MATPPPFVFPALPASPPPFVFPTRSNAPALVSSPRLSSPLSSPVDVEHKGHSRVHSRTLSPTLPVFQYNPGANLAPAPQLVSLPCSPVSSLPIPISGRAVGHRRDGSAFIGGDGKKGGPGLMSVSPTKGEGLLPPPNPVTPSRDHASHQRHTHRRSGAISCHDLSFMKSAEIQRKHGRLGGSAPTSPAQPDARPMFFPHEEHRASVGTLPSTNAEELTTQPRVRFDMNLEEIPGRPLSTLSSETSSTMTTIRGRSESISSLASLTNASPNAVTGPRIKWTPSSSRQGSSEEERARPNTAGPVMTGENCLAAHLGGAVPALKRSKSASDSLKPVFPSVHDSTIAVQGIPAREMGKPHLRGVSLTPLRISTSFSDSGDANVVTQAGAKKDRKAGKTHKIVKTWAGSILSRKAKQRKKQKAARRCPTPPTRALADSLPSTPSLDFDDEDATCTIVSQPSTPSRSARVVGSGEFPMPTLFPRETPMIDLDAALGPFNTPGLSPDVGSPSRGGFSSAKRRMHSSGIMSGFSGPGMHYHRRTESAPEMAAFEFGHFSIHRFGSTSTMADVFEEDEEDENEGSQKAGQATEEAGGTTVNKGGEGHDSGSENVIGLGVNVVDADEDIDPETPWTFDREIFPARASLRKNSHPSEVEPTQLEVADNGRCPPTALLESALIRESLSPVRLIDGNQPLIHHRRKNSESSFILPSSTYVPRPRLAPAPIDLSSRSPNYSFTGPYTPSLTSSSLPSPEFSGVTFDVSRAATAASSFTDEQTLDSLLMGEPGPEVRISVDDVPSLTSSSSTMTSAINNFPGPFAGNMEYGGRGERSASLTSAVPGRPGSSRSARKRSSLASLSRLMTSSHGEKSKLSIEERAPPDSPEKASKDTKGKRLSRMMQFWKPKQAS